MYKDFYRMQTEAFISLPLPGVFFKSKTHKIGWHYLVYGIKSKEPFLLLAGDYGMGKTLLCLKLVKALKKKNIYPFTYISSPNYSYTKIVREIVGRLGLEIQEEDESSLQILLYKYFENEKALKPVYIILDDVQEFDSMTLKKLRLLANFNHYGVFPIRLIFFAHTSFFDRLKSPSLRPLDQRIRRRYRLVPFDLLETKEYIYFRLLNAGASKSPYFPDDAIEQIFYYSRGIPRVINNVCDACLLIGASRELTVIDSSLVAEALESLGWHYKNEDEQAALSFEGRGGQNTGVEQVVEKPEIPDHEELDFTNIGSTGFQESKTAALSSQGQKGSSLLNGMKLKIILFLLILIGGFVLWPSLQKGMLGISKGSTMGHKETKERHRIYSTLEGKKEGFQGDIKGAYIRKEAKADESETARQEDSDYFYGAPSNTVSPDRAEDDKISMLLPSMNMATASPEKKSYQPYSLILASCRYQKSALKALDNFKMDGLTLLFPGKVNMRKSGVWWVVYMGHYKSQEEARKAREEFQLFDAIIKKTPYANLIGVFSTNTEMEDMCQRLETLGYFPYTMEMEKGMYRLLVGAHITMKKAEEQRLDLQAAGIKSRVVKR